LLGERLACCCVYAGHGSVSQYSGQSESFGAEPSRETETQINKRLSLNVCRCFLLSLFETDDKIYVTLLDGYCQLPDVSWQGATALPP